jgi:hypothetical protein
MDGGRAEASVAKLLARSDSPDDSIIPGEVRWRSIVIGQSSEGKDGKQHITDSYNPMRRRSQAGSENRDEAFAK